MWRIVLILSIFSLPRVWADLCSEESYLTELQQEVDSYFGEQPLKKMVLSKTWILTDRKDKLKFLSVWMPKKELLKEQEKKPEIVHCANVDCVALKILPQPELYYRALRDYLRFGSRYPQLRTLSLEQVRTMSVAQMMVHRFAKSPPRGVIFQVRNLENESASGLWNEEVLSLDPRWLKPNWSGVSIVLHELAHVIDTNSMNTRRAEVRSLNDEYPVSEYASGDALIEGTESFAEHFSYQFAFSKLMNSSSSIEKSFLMQKWFKESPSLWLEKWLEKWIESKSGDSRFSRATVEAKFGIPNQNFVQYYLEPQMKGPYYFRTNYVFFGLKKNVHLEYLVSELPVFQSVARKPLSEFAAQVLSEVGFDTKEIKTYCDYVSSEEFLKDQTLIYLIN